MDSHLYLKRVEEALEDNYVDVSPLTSGYEYETMTYWDPLPLRHNELARANMVSYDDLTPGQFSAALDELEEKYVWHSTAFPITNTRRSDMLHQETERGAP